MERAVLKYMISYDKEDDREKYRYKEVNVNRPQDVKYEDGMYTFMLLQYVIREIDGKKYYVLVDNKKERYAFGHSETCKEILTRMRNGEDFREDISIIENWAKDCGENSTLFISGKNNLLIDYFDKKVPVNSVNPATPDMDITEEDLVESKIEWYVRYKKIGDDNWYYCPTFCSDKKFRSEFADNVECYQFVEVMVYEIEDKKYEEIYRIEDKVYENNGPDKEKDETDMAIDGAVNVLYGNSNDHMFEGYTMIYPFNTEDGASVCRLHHDNIKGQRTLTITGSGDFMLDLFLYGAQSVTCFDINGLSKYYALLKFYFIKAGMSYEEYKEYFFNKESRILDKEFYDKYKNSLDARVRKFWDAIYNYLENNKKVLYNSEHNLFYKIYDFFGSANKSYRNQSSYFNEENYQRLQNILKDKTLENVEFYDQSLFNVPQILEGQKFGYAYLSNVIDFTELYFKSNDMAERFRMFKDFIVTEFMPLLIDNGAMAVGFISKGWDTNMYTNDYKNIFPLEEGFSIESLKPYNNEDCVLSYGRTKIYINNDSNILK